MSINYHFADVVGHGAALRADAGNLEYLPQQIIHAVTEGQDFWRGQGQGGHEDFVRELGKAFAVIYDRANTHGQHIQNASDNMSSTDAAVRSSWG